MFESFSLLHDPHLSVTLPYMHISMVH